MKGNCIIVVFCIAAIIIGACALLYRHKTPEYRYVTSDMLIGENPAIVDKTIRECNAVTFKIIRFERVSIGKGYRVMGKLTKDLDICAWMDAKNVESLNVGDTISVVGKLDLKEFHLFVGNNSGKLAQLIDIVSS